MTLLAELKKEWMQDTDFRAEYVALEEEFAIAHALIQARIKAGLSQAEVARRMGTTQSVVARLEGGGSLPSLRTIQRYASATGARAVVKIVPGQSTPVG